MHARARKVKWIIVGTMLVANVALGVALARSAHPKLTVAFLDIGQGDSIFIQTPAGHQALIDTGTGRHILARLGSMMPWHDRSLDLVVATHPDTDHIGGMPAVFARFDVANLMEPGSESGTAAYAAYRKSVVDERAAAILARHGQVVNFGDGSYLRILFPDRDIAAKDTNASSIIAQLVYGETEIMLTGDAPKAVERYLLELEGGVLASDILKAGHHGSKTSSDPAFVAAVAPAYAVISASEENRYGHPHRETLDTFAAARVNTLSTAQRGTVVFVSDGNELVLRD